MAIEVLLASKVLFIHKGTNCFSNGLSSSASSIGSTSLPFELTFEFQKMYTKLTDRVVVDAVTEV